MSKFRDSAAGPPGPVRSSAGRMDSETGGAVSTQVMQKDCKMETQSSFWRYCATPDWEPSLNLCECPDAYYVCIDLAGMRREDIDVQVQSGRLGVRGTRPTPRPDTEAEHLHMHHMEIEHGPFCREIELPANVDAQGISARYKDGVLWIRLPKFQEQAQP